MSTTGDNSPPVLRRDDGAVAILTLNRPAARNSLSARHDAELQATLDTVAADSGIRSVVLAAEGPAFSAGHDLKEITAASGRCRWRPPASTPTAWRPARR